MRWSDRQIYKPTQTFSNDPTTRWRLWYSRVTAPWPDQSSKAIGLLIGGDGQSSREEIVIFREKFSRENRQENFGARTREMFGYTGVSNKGGEVDLESGETLYPGLSYGENQLRWGFIRKVYGILAAQIVLTTIVSSVTVLYSPINDLLRGNSGLLLFLCFLPLICKLVISESLSKGPRLFIC